MLFRSVHKLNRLQAILLVVLTAVITFVFYFILKKFHTANLVISTVSVATSFSASYLLVCRSPFYALAYAANDIVLIILWVLASLENISYLPMVMCFVMFLLNDMYGLINWRKMSARQNLL